MRRRLTPRHRPGPGHPEPATAPSCDDLWAHDLAGLRRRPPHPPGVIHGDAHLGNLIPTPAGPVLCDFDSTGSAPVNGTSPPPRSEPLRFDYGPSVHDELSAAYGVDVTTWPGFPILRRIRELQLVTSVLPLLAANPALRPQWEHRLATLTHADPEAPWTPYANRRT